MGPMLGPAHAPTLAASGGMLTAIVVTVVVLLLLGTVLWSFLRRGSAAGIAPLAVDQLDAPRISEPADPALLPTEAEADDGGRTGSPGSPPTA